MKAQRRHELQKNSLAQFFTDLPLYFRFHANKFLIAIIGVCLLILAYRYHSTTVQQAVAQNKADLESARNAIVRLEKSDQFPAPPMQRISERKKLIGQITEAIDHILQNTKDPADSTLRSEAVVAQGDFNWTLANLTPIAGASTQPLLAMPQTTAQYLDNAEGSYQRVLHDYDAQKFAKADALLSLAAISEDRAEWDKAVAYYNAAISDEGIAEPFKALARQRLGLIPQIRVPVYLGEYSATQPATQATTRPTTSTSKPE